VGAIVRRLMFKEAYIDEHSRHDCSLMAEDPDDGPLGSIIQPICWSKSDLV